ncbi:MAG: glutamate--tRNA ligase [Planctomycetaceae bacterium]|nr:glutamate--tRNA ligase [Planctomycetaceae bacterium]
MTVRTRFAPSPTGYLHIGGVRTALFNWLFARQHGGQFLLRVDDTDQQRNLKEALAPILEGFRWLGLNWDEGPEVGGPFAPYFQSQRSQSYQRAVDVLLAKGLAYRDFATAEEVQAERAAAEAAKQDFRYSRRWMATSVEQEAAWKSEGRQSVVRLKMPTEGYCEFEDLIRGPQSYQWSQEQDHVIQRADGSFIYHLASVVDDVEFQITHVIRAIEHLPNTPRQIFIFRGLLDDPNAMPKFAHIPFVAEPGSKSKLSKRKIDNYVKRAEFKSMVDHGNQIAQRLGWQDSLESFNPVLVEFYSRLGYTPSAVLNYLLLLGWSLDDKTEDFTVEEMTRAFSLDRVVKSPASFDPEKLMAFQTRHYLRLSVADRAALAVPFLAQANLVSNNEWEKLNSSEQAKVLGIVEHAGDRIKVAGDILQFDDFFTSTADLAYDDKAFQKRLVAPEQAEHLVTEFLKVLQVIAEFRAPILKTALEEFCHRFEIKIGDIIHALRLALTGRAVGFGVFESFEVLGREESLARIRQSLQRIGSVRRAQVS